MMSNSQNQQVEPILTLNGNKYNITKLPAETQELIKALKIADAQIRFYEDSLKVLTIGRQAMVKQLNQKLKEVESIN